MIACTRALRALTTNSTGMIESMLKPEAWTSSVRNPPDQHLFCAHPCTADFHHFIMIRAGALLELLTFVRISTIRMGSPGAWRKAMDLWHPSKWVSYIQSHLSAHIMSGLGMFCISTWGADWHLINVFVVICWIKNTKSFLTKKEHTVILNLEILYAKKKTAWFLVLSGSKSCFIESTHTLQYFRSY